LRVSGRAAEDEVRVVEEEVGKTVGVAIQYNAVVFFDNLDKWR
jgi:hypothetical protein